VTVKKRYFFKTYISRVGLEILENKIITAVIDRLTWKKSTPF